MARRETERNGEKWSMHQLNETISFNHIKLQTQFETDARSYINHEMKLKSQDLNYFPARKQGKDGENEKVKMVQEAEGARTTYQQQQL